MGIDFTSVAHAACMNQIERVGKRTMYKSNLFHIFGVKIPFFIGHAQWNNVILHDIGEDICCQCETLSSSLYSLS